MSKNWVELAFDFECVWIGDIVWLILDEIHYIVKGRVEIEFVAFLFHVVDVWCVDAVFEAQ